MKQEAIKEFDEFLKETLSERVKVSYAKEAGRNGMVKMCFMGSGGARFDAICSLLKALAEMESDNLQGQRDYVNLVRDMVVLEVEGGGPNV